MPWNMGYRAMSGDITTKRERHQGLRFSKLHGKAKAVVLIYEYFKPDDVDINLN